MKSEKPRMIGYFTAWGADDKGYTPARVPAEKLTHLNYAFTSIDPNSQQCILGDPQADVQRLFSDGESVDGIADDSGAAVKGYLKAGVPPEKLVLGVPFYDRGWEGVSGTNQGLFQPVKGPVEGISEPGMFDYAEIVKTYLPTSIRHWHPEAKVPWINQPATRIFISYDDPESLIY